MMTPEYRHSRAMGLLQNSFLQQPHCHAESAQALISRPGKMRVAPHAREKIFRFDRLPLHSSHAVCYIFL